MKDGDARGIKTFRENPGKFSLALDNYNLQDVEKIYKKWLKNRADTEENFIDFANNLDWRVNQELTAEYQSNFDDVYFYLFSEWSPIENLRACHDSDLPYVFDKIDGLPNSSPQLVKIIQKSWAAFATTGNQNNEFIPHWEKYSAENRQTLEINSGKVILHKDFNTENLNSLRYIYEN